MSLWNVRFLEAPPISTYRLDSYNIEVDRLHQTVKEAKEFFANQEHLQAEAALLSRMIYRMKLTFRGHKCLKAMEKTNTALLRCLQMNFAETISMLYDVLPSKYERNTYFPSKNLVDYVLVRLQGFSKLMCRIVECSRIASFYMQKTISLGHNWRLAMIVLAVMSRIWFLTKNVVKFCCKLYAELLPCSKLLKKTALQWLPVDYTFPDDLKNWLQVDWIEETDTAPPNAEMTQNVVNATKNEDEIKICNQNEDDENNRVVINNDRKIFKGFEVCEDDIGEVIESTPSGPSQKSKRNRKNKRKNKSNDQTQIGNVLDHISTLEDITKLIKSENHMRNVSPEKCTLKQIDKLQWNILNKSLNKLIKVARQNEGKGKDPNAAVNKIKDLIKLNIR